MKSGKTCSPSRRKPGESLFVRIEANLTGQQNFVVKHSSRSRPSDDGGGGGREGGEFGFKINGAAHPGPSPGPATEIDLLGLYVLFAKCGPRNIFKEIYLFLYLCYVHMHVWIKRHFKGSVFCP